MRYTSRLLTGGGVYLETIFERRKPLGDAVYDFLP